MVTTIDDLKDFFTGGTVWKHTEDHDGKMIGNSNHFSYEIEPDEVIFSYHVESNDDSDDSEDGESPEPLKKITEFLSRGIPGGEFFDKMAFSPDSVSFYLGKVASKTEMEREDNNIIKILRRMSTAISIVRSKKLRFAVVLDGDDAFNSLKEKMKIKGWNFSESKDFRGIPNLEFKIGDEFDGEISVDSISYLYTFNLKGYPDLTNTGSTKNPILAFEKYYKSQDIKDAEKELDKEESKNEDEQVNSFGKTVPSSKEEKTVIPGKRF